MTPDLALGSPWQWLSSVATADPGRVCLIDSASTMSYGEVLTRVSDRANEIKSSVGPWDIVPVEVSLDARSVIEVLASQKAGAVPMPHGGAIPSLPTPTAVGAAVCVGTSGSSGSPKIVPLTYDNLSASVHASRSRLGNDETDRWLLSLPLHHVGGLSVIWRTLEAGGSAVIAPFDASGSGIERHQPTIVSLVPTMLRRLHAENPTALASLRLVLVGGASLDPDLWEACVQSNIKIVPTYGSTEAGSQIATAESSSTAIEAAIGADTAAGWVGSPLDGMAVSILDVAGEPVSPGATGSIAIEGPAVFAGYLGDVLREGAFITDDLGHLDVSGHLRITGRRDDVFVSGGENASLDRITRVLQGFDGIEDVCVVTLDDDDWGTVAGAVVVTETDLAEFDTMVRRDLEPHERPKRWLRRKSIPLLANGKRDLVAVRAMFEEELWT